MTQANPATPPSPAPEIVAALDQIPPAQRRAMLTLRQMIFEEAGADPRFGPIDESLKWGQPSYVPARPRIGTAIRLGTQGNRVALFTHCQTSVMADVRPLFGPEAQFDGTRGVGFAPEDLPEMPIRGLIRAALGYYL